MIHGHLFTLCLFRGVFFSRLLVTNFPIAFLLIPWSTCQAFSCCSSCGVDCTSGHFFQANEQLHTLFNILPSRQISPLLQGHPGIRLCFESCSLSGKVSCFVDANLISVFHSHLLIGNSLWGHRGLYTNKP